MRKGHHLLDPTPQWCSIRDPQMLQDLCQPVTKLHDVCFSLCPLCCGPISTSRHAIRRTAVNHTLRSKPWAGHPADGKKLIRHSPCPQEMDKPVRKPGIITHPHSFNIYYKPGARGHAEASETCRTRLISQTRAEDKHVTPNKHHAVMSGLKRSVRTCRGERK